MKYEKLKNRRNHAKDFKEKEQNDNEKLGFKMYSENLKELERKKKEKQVKLKNHSLVEYDNYRRKYETSMSNYTVYNQKMKR